MQIPVLIEPIAQNGFRAKTGEPLLLSAEGITRDEAVDKLRALVKTKLTSGASLLPIEIGSANNPWLAMAGIHDPADPLVQEWKQSMAEYRQQVENDPDYS
jgi:hypothetical protein